MSQSANPADDARVVGGGGGGGSDRSFDADEIPDGGGASEDGDVVDHVGSETGSEGDGDEEGDEEGDGDGSDDDAGPSGGGCVASRLRSRSNSVSVSEDRGTQSLEFNPPGYMRPTRAKASNRGGGGLGSIPAGRPAPPPSAPPSVGSTQGSKGRGRGVAGRGDGRGPVGRGAPHPRGAAAAQPAHIPIPAGRGRNREGIASLNSRLAESAAAPTIEGGKPRRERAEDLEAARAKAKETQRLEREQINKNARDERSSRRLAPETAELNPDAGGEKRGCSKGHTPRKGRDRRRSPDQSRSRSPRPASVDSAGPAPTPPASRRARSAGSGRSRSEVLNSREQSAARRLLSLPHADQEGNSASREDSSRQEEADAGISLLAAAAGTSSQPESRPGNDAEPAVPTPPAWAAGMRVSYAQKDGVYHGTLVRSAPPFPNRGNRWIINTDIHGQTVVFESALRPFVESAGAAGGGAEAVAAQAVPVGPDGAALPDSVLVTAQAVSADAAAATAAPVDAGVGAADAVIPVSGAPSSVWGVVGFDEASPNGDILLRVTTEDVRDLRHFIVSSCYAGNCGQRDLEIIQGLLLKSRVDDIDISASINEIHSAVLDFHNACLLSNKRCQYSLTLNRIFLCVCQHFHRTKPSKYDGLEMYAISGTRGGGQIFGPGGGGRVIKFYQDVVTIGVCFLSMPCFGHMPLLLGMTLKSSILVGCSDSCFDYVVGELQQSVRTTRSDGIKVLVDKFIACVLENRKHLRETGSPMPSTETRDADVRILSFSSPTVLNRLLKEAAAEEGLPAPDALAAAAVPAAPAVGDPASAAAEGAASAAAAAEGAAPAAAEAVGEADPAAAPAVGAADPVADVEAPAAGPTAPAVEADADDPDPSLEAGLAERGLDLLSRQTGGVGGAFGADEDDDGDAPTPTRAKGSRGPSSKANESFELLKNMGIPRFTSDHEELLGDCTIKMLQELCQIRGIRCTGRSKSKFIELLMSPSDAPAAAPSAAPATPTPRVNAEEAWTELSGMDTNDFPRFLDEHLALLNAITVPRLQTLCKNRGIPFSGKTKPQLITALTTPVEDDPAGDAPAGARGRARPRAEAQAAEVDLVETLDTLNSAMRVLAFNFLPNPRADDDTGPLKAVGRDELNGRDDFAGVAFSLHGSLDVFRRYLFNIIPQGDPAGECGAGPAMALRDAITAAVRIAGLFDSPNIKFGYEDETFRCRGCIILDLLFISGIFQDIDGEDTVKLENIAVRSCLGLFDSYLNTRAAQLQRFNTGFMGDVNLCFSRITASIFHIRRGGLFPDLINHFGELHQAINLQNFLLMAKAFEVYIHAPESNVHTLTDAQRDEFYGHVRMLMIDVDEICRLCQANGPSGQALFNAVKFNRQARRPAAAAGVDSRPPLTEDELRGWEALGAARISEIFAGLGICKKGSLTKLMNRLRNKRNRSKIPHLADVAPSAGGSADPPPFTEEQERAWRALDRRQLRKIFIHLDVEYTKNNLDSLRRHLFKTENRYRFPDFPGETLREIEEEERTGGDAAGEEEPEEEEEAGGDAGGEGAAGGGAADAETEDEDEEAGAERGPQGAPTPSVAPVVDPKPTPARQSGTPVPAAGKVAETEAERAARRTLSESLGVLPNGWRKRTSTKSDRGKTYYQHDVSGHNQWIWPLIGDELPPVPAAPPPAAAAAAARVASAAAAAAGPPSADTAAPVPAASPAVPAAPSQAAAAAAAAAAARAAAPAAAPVPPPAATADRPAVSADVGAAAAGAAVQPEIPPPADPSPKRQRVRLTPRPPGRVRNMFTRNLPPTLSERVFQPLFFNNDGYQVSATILSFEHVITLPARSTSERTVIAIWGVREGEEHASMWRMTVDANNRIIEADREGGRHDWILDETGLVVDRGEEKYSVSDSSYSNLTDPDMLVSHWFTPLFPCG